MKKLLFISLFILPTIMVYSQARVVLNNNGYIVIDNSAYLVIDNSNANAISTLGTGGKIISEAETDVIKWNIGTSAVGTYVIPWATSVATSAVKIPLSMTITAAGVGAGNVIFSTYETTTDMNTPWQSGITNMCSSTTNADGSLLVADRFWQINANTYTTKPTVNMTIAYNPAANELVGTNTLIEANLLAQRFNSGAVASNACFTGAGSWESLLFGTNNAALDKVSNIIVSPANFFKDWILTDFSAPLPVKLLNFEVKCQNIGKLISWSTATEISNDFFVVEKSYDATTFFDISTIQGAGNSNTINSYSIIDDEPSNATTYYRLKQVDFDGTTEYHNVVASNCSNTNFEVSNLVLESNQLNFKITTTSNEKIDIYLYDYRGRKISNKKTIITSGVNSIKLPYLNLSTGIYMLSIVGETNIYATKLLNRKD